MSSIHLSSQVTQGYSGREGPHEHEDPSHELLAGSPPSPHNHSGVKEEAKDRVQEEAKDRVQVKDEGKEVTKEPIPEEESKKKSKNLEEESESRQPESVQFINDKEGKSKQESDPEIKSFSKSIHSTPRHKPQPSPDPSDDKWIGVSPPPNLTPLVFPTSMK